MTIAEHVEISTGPMTLDEVLSVAAGARVEYSEQALDLIRRSRAVVESAIVRGEAMYGVTTGVGHARNDRLPEDTLAAWQPALVEMHLGAVGDTMPTQLIRAGMVVRINGFARGGAGVSMGVARTLEAMLNEQIHPLIPRAGSVGTGDLGQLAYLARAMLGRGWVDWKGEHVAAAEALAGSGLTPVRLQPKDALALISSNALTVAHGIYLWRRMADLLTFCDHVAALSMEAIGANPSVIDPTVSEARGSPGQEKTAHNLREALAGSSRVDADTASVQDPLSFRVVPQVHGACRDLLAALETELGRELNARSDNPMVDIASDRVLSNGNFHAMNLALATESLRLGLAHVGLLSDRRSGQLWNATVTALSAAGDQEDSPQPFGDATPPFLAGLALRYPAAARYTRLRQLASPVTLDVPPLDLSVEDHATNAAEALDTLEEAIAVVIDLLTVETLIGFGKMFLSQPAGELGAGTSKLVDRVANVTDDLPAGSPPNETMARVRAALGSQLV